MLLTMGGPVNLRHRKLMEDLSAARPELPPDVEHWGGSERAKQILAQILASEAPAGTPGSRRKAGVKVFVAYGAIGAVVVALAIVLGLYFTSGGREQVVQSSTSTSVAQGGQPVTVGEALRQILALAKSTPGIEPSQSSPLPGRGPDLVEEAVAFRLVKSTETATIELDHTVTLREFALWLWRGFSSVLPQGSSNAAISVISVLTQEERQAIDGLARAGVLQPSSSGPFDGDKVLTQSEQSSLLGRVRTILR